MTLVRVCTSIIMILLMIFEPGVMVADFCGQCYYKDMKYVSGKTGGTWKCIQQNVKHSRSLR